MALQRATYTGVNDIMNAYDSFNDQGQYNYSVWLSSSDIAFQSIEKDSEKARELLKNCLTALEQADNDDLFFIKFHPKDLKTPTGFIDRKTLVIGTIPVRVCPIGESGSHQNFVKTSGAVSGVPRDLYDMLRDLPATLDTKISAALDARLAQIEDDPEPEEVDQIEKYVGIINGIASNPQIMSVVGQILSYLKPQTMSMAPRINGTPTENPVNGVSSEEIPVNLEILNEALDRLSKVCRVDTDLLLLANMSEENPAMFNMLLTQLRSK
jgi:hypothetical protein